MAGKKLFVGNLSFTMTDDDFKQIFSSFGNIVSANIVKDKFTQKGKGFGFVEFETEEEAVKAMSLDGSDQMGRNIAVKEAIARPETTQPSAPTMAAPSEPAEPVAAPSETPAEPVIAETSEAPAEPVSEPAEPSEPTVG